MDNKYVFLRVLLHLKKTLLSIEKPQRLKMPVLGTSFGVAVCFLEFFVVYVQGKQGRLILQIVHTDDTCAY